MHYMAAVITPPARDAQEALSEVAVQMAPYREAVVDEETTQGYWDWWVIGGSYSAALQASTRALVRRDYHLDPDFSSQPKGLWRGRIGVAADICRIRWIDWEAIGFARALHAERLRADLIRRYEAGDSEARWQVERNGGRIATLDEVRRAAVAEPFYTYTVLTPDGTWSSRSCSPDPDEDAASCRDHAAYLRDALAANDRDGFLAIIDYHC